MHDSTTIPGVRIALRDWRAADLERYAYWLGPGHRWQEFDGPYYPRPTAEQIVDDIARKRARIEASALPMPRRSLVVAPLDTDLLLGTVTWTWESEETNWLKVGIALYDPEWWGRGIGYEALGLWSDYLFRAMPALVRLDLRTWSGNRGMIRLAEKLGYLEEARFRQARIVDGQYYDGLGYGVLRTEWERRYPTGFAAHLEHREMLSRCPPTSR